MILSKQKSLHFSGIVIAKAIENISVVITFYYVDVNVNKNNLSASFENSSRIALCLASNVFDCSYCASRI